MNRLGGIIAIYLGGLLIGLNVVSFPSSSAFLVERLGYSEQQYGAIYLPQLLLAIIGALGGGAAIRALGLKRMYLIALGCFVLSQICFAASINVDGSYSLPLIMTATALFGFGFGFGGGPLNGIAAALFPAHGNSALTALHMTAGLGMTVGPLLLGSAIQGGLWQTIPIVLAAFGSLLAIVAWISRLPEPGADRGTGDAPRSPSKSLYFWLIMCVAVFYALAEGTFSNWAILYVQQGKSLSAQVAATALASFWGALTLGRLFATFLLVRVPAMVVLLSLPPLMLGAFLIIPYAEGESQVILAFALAGLGCSAFFPLMVAVAAEPFPRSVSYIASMLTAALMFGVGIGSYVIGAFSSSFSLDQLYTFSAAYPVIVLVLLLVARSARRRRTPG